MNTKKIKKEFAHRFDSRPILAFAPGRINLIGEHTDYNGGYVFPAAVDKGIISAVARNEQDRCRIHAIDIDAHYEFSIKKVKPLPKKGWQNYVRTLKLNQGMLKFMIKC